MLTNAIDRQKLQAVAAGFAFAILAALLAPEARAATTAEEAEDFLHEFAVSGVAILEKGDYTEAEREKEFRKLAQRGFALEAIGKFVVGRYWREMTPAQRAEYKEIFSEWLLKSYANRLGGYDGQRLEILKSAETNSRYNDVIVSTRVLSDEGQPPINAAWRVRKFGDDYKIIDIMVEGTSMVGTQRREFESVIRKVGVDGLIDNLRERLAVLIADAD